MERVKDEPKTLEIFENDIEFYINDYCEKYNIQDLKKETQNVWNGCLGHIKRHVFNDPSILKNNTEHHEYNISLVNLICDYYISICNIYDKIISMNGFSTLTGIDNDTIYNWGYINKAYNINDTVTVNIYNIYGDIIGQEKASIIRMEIYKKLKEGYEQSLENRLVTGNKNPIGTIATLKHHFGWESPYTADRSQKTIDSRTPEQIAQNYNTNTNQPQLPS